VIFFQICISAMASSRTYCYSELAVLFPSGIRNHRQYSFRQPTEGWPGWVGLDGLVEYQTVTHLSTNRAGRRVTWLMCPTTLQLSQTATRYLYLSNTVQYSLVSKSA